MRDQGSNWKGYLTIDADGRLRIPADLAAACGLEPGVRVYARAGENGLLLRQPAAALRRVYVEATNTCNLGCRTCIRNAWDEPLGTMSRETYARVLEGVRTFEPRPLVFFGGFGEPLGHPDILTMVEAAQRAGARTELITNGVLLDQAAASGLIEAGLDFLWVSIDGASPSSYRDVRLGDELPRIIGNLQELRRLRYLRGAYGPQLGIAFVAMKRNLNDLPEVASLGRRLGARKFQVSNILPHTPEMREEVLYTRSLWENGWGNECLSMPRLDASVEFLQALGQLVHRADWSEIAPAPFGGILDTCPFVARGSISVRWDGQVSPCLPLLHAHESYLGDTLRRVHSYFVGCLLQRSLRSLWQDPAYLRLRERLLEFDFSPCTSCNSCEMAESNQEDCFGSAPPACGGCLWAQGYIRCP